MMSIYEFKEPFLELTNCFHVNGADKKVNVYYKHLSKLSLTTFTAVVDRASKELDKFPTIFKILQLAAELNPPTARKCQECSKCDGYGTVSMWNHTFRAHCIHGEQVSKQIALVPVTNEEKKHFYGRLNREWNEIYGKDLVEGKSFQGDATVQKIKDLFNAVEVK